MSLLLIKKWVWIVKIFTHAPIFFYEIKGLGPNGLNFLNKVLRAFDN